MAMKKVTELQQRTSDFSHVYFLKSSTEATGYDYSQPDFEFPVVEGSINYSMGEVDYEYTKLVSGAVWATKRTKGDPDISFQVATNNDEVADLFGIKTAVTGIKTPTDSSGTGRSGVSIDLTSIKVATGTVIFTDDAGNAEILPDCELTASRGKDGVAYWNVKVVPSNKIVITTS